MLTAEALTPCSALRACRSQPNKELNKVTLTKDFRRVAKAIKKNTADNFYRPDLTKGKRTRLA